MGLLSAARYVVVGLARASWGGVKAAHRHWKTRRMAAQLLGVSAQAVGSGKAARYAVYFSPKGGCEAAVVAVIAAARSSVLVQAYGFTSKPVADALIAARGRGVSVRIVLDSEGKTARSNKGAACAAAGIEVTWDAKHLIAHNKVVVVDGQVVVTGSYNFSASAETGNAENLLVINDAAIAAIYAANWEHHRGHSEP